MKIKLLNNGGYCFGDDVTLEGKIFNASKNFPHDNLAYVRATDLLKAGADPEAVYPYESSYPFDIGTECILVEDEE